MADKNDTPIDNADLSKIFDALGAAEKLWMGAYNECTPMTACSACGGKGSTVAGSLGASAPCHKCDGEGTVEDDFGENPSVIPPELAAARTDAKLLAEAVDHASRMQAMANNPAIEDIDQVQADAAAAAIPPKAKAAEVLAAIAALPDPKAAVRKHRAALAAAPAEMTPRAQLAESPRRKRADPDDPVALADDDLDEMLGGEG